MRHRATKRRLPLLVPLVLIGCIGEVDPRGSGEAEHSQDAEFEGSAEGLYTQSGVQLWTSNGNVVPVCFTTPGMQQERQQIQNALRRTWTRYANVKFTGFGGCPFSGSQRFVRVQLRRPPECAPGTFCPNAGGSATSGMAAFKEPSQGYSVDLVFGWDTGLGRREYLAVHEFGHVLGFGHEQDRADNSDPVDSMSGGSNCNPNGSIAGTYRSSYDRESIMHYCGSHGNNAGRLSTLDKRAVIALYGPAPRLFAENRSSRIRHDYNGDGRADQSWYEPNAMEFVVRFSNGSGGWNEVRRDTSNWGEWSGGKHFARGDYNGDGRTDWSWYASWAQDFVVMFSNGAGGWTEAHNYTGFWGNWTGGAHFSVGDYNGDGRDDWSWYAPWAYDFIVMLSNGAGGFTQVHNGTSGWGNWEQGKNFQVGDYNGDGRDDWSWYAPWTYDFIVMLSDGGGHWWDVHNETSRWGSWHEGTHFAVGDYNGDGRDDWSWYAPWSNDYVVMLSDGGGHFWDVHNWTGSWGNWSAGRHFAVGDYNGDGRDDWSWYAPWSKDFIVMLSNGGGHWSEVHNGTHGWGDWSAGSQFAVGDHNGDGRDDWSWYAWWANNWELMRSDGGGHFYATEVEY